MHDFVPLGSGNSRFLKTVNNAKTLYPTYDSFLNALVAGNLPIDLNGINAAGVAQMGTPLNKQNLLQDATAAALGLSTDASVNDALLSVTRVANWHVWEALVTSVVETEEEPFRIWSNPSSYGTSGTQYWYYADSYKLVGDQFELVNPQQIGVQYSSYGNATALRGKYVCNQTVSTANDPMRKIPEDAVFTSEFTGTMYQVTCPYALRITAVPDVFEQYVTSPNENAYPQDGEVDGVHYKYVKQIGEAGAKIETGSYKGTGTYGASNPNILSFSFAPKFVWIYAIKLPARLEALNNSYGSDSTSYAHGFLISELLTTTYQRNVAPHVGGAAEQSYAKKSEDGKTFYWYHISDATNQLNYNQYTYYYIALG